MAGESSNSRFVSRNALKSQQPEASENEFDTPLNPIHFPPPRTPLNSIPDPSQCRKEIHDPDFDSKDRGGRLLDRSGNVALSYGAPRVMGRSGKAHSESNSAQSTPARSGSRISLGGAAGAFSGHRTAHNILGRGPISSRVSRGASVASSEFLTQVPHFELVEDPSFWADHNVQVLIRIRPLNAMERVSQGYGQCLRQDSGQTLVWLGHPETRFTFDHVACETISQEKLFSVAGLPMVENCMSGYNSCMFAYGQTGSGKTYTMMGDIYEMKGKLSDDCGITPRIFEYLFSRIKVEEESRRNEKLKYSCKCSFVEIYNEQITDLLEPSSTNLQLREDSNKGVYVENLTEYDVRTVSDVIKLLLQGAANRKMAATHMNSESSRSHSVFTCIIESDWEKDSLTHFRYARLNLVDLAGSERQKSSGAEGDRLKEAANINKSLSTLGLVIMSLVDLAHGKHRHVPYRDSRLTFLLQDSLGGNSKTTIIANVSPSTCSANETLSTLKFAQRAKLIQNNAKVNEDASGDVATLQRQIQQLKGQLSFLMKHHKSSEESFGFSKEYESSGEVPLTDNHRTQSVLNKKIRCMESALLGALRREKMSEIALQKLEAEVEHMSRLAAQREEDVQRTKMMLRFREEKIKRLELLADGAISTDKHLAEENNTLLEEIQLLKTKIDRNPELTRFALENIRLIEQLQLFQNFYEQGERETLLAEVSELRDQLIGMLEGEVRLSSPKGKLDYVTVRELEDCRNTNSRLMREVDELRAELGKYLHHTQDFCDSVDSLSTRNVTEDDMASSTQGDDASQSKNDRNVGDAHSIDKKELMDARALIEALESEQLYLIKELQRMQDENQGYMEIISNKDKVEIQLVHKLDSHSMESGVSDKQNEDSVMESCRQIDSKALQAKLAKLSKDLEESKLLNSKYEDVQATKSSQQNQVDLVCEQVEMETARTILQLQEEVTSLQLEFQERLCCMTQENTVLRSSLAAKEEEIRTLSSEWDRAILELTTFIVDGSRSLKDASSYIESIAYTFPQGNVLISEHIERATRVCIEKEETILLLQRSLEAAQKMVMDMEHKLSSLKGAAIALTEFQKVEDNESTTETIRLNVMLNEKINRIKMLEGTLKCKDDEVTEAERRYNAALIVVKWLSDHRLIAQRDDAERNIVSIPEMTAVTSQEEEDAKTQVELAQFEVLESMKAISDFKTDAEMHVSALQTDMQKTSSIYGKLVQDLVKDVHESSSNLREMKNNCEDLQSEGNKVSKLDNYYSILSQIRDELVKISDKLHFMEDCISTKDFPSCYQLEDEDSAAEESWSTDCSISSSDISTESVASRNKLGVSTSQSYLTGKKAEGMMDLPFESESFNVSKNQDSNTTGVFFLKKELKATFNAFNKLYVELSTVLNDKFFGDHCYTEDMSRVFPSFDLRIKETKEGCHNMKELIADEKFSHASSFFTKFEEAHATMQEADLMLNALLKENESAKELTGMWKQAGENLMVERATLSEEVEWLRSSIHLKEGEDEVLQEQIDHSFEEIANSMSSLEESFQNTQKDVEKKLETINSDVLSMGRDILCNVCNLRSSLEDVYLDIMVKGIALFVLFRCNAGKLGDVSSSNIEYGNDQFGQQACPSIKSQMQTLNKDDIKFAGEKSIEEINENEGVKHLHEGNLVYENLALKKELERKEVLLEGLLFDFTLLQESTSSTKDIKDETEKSILALSQVRYELEMKSRELDEMLVENKRLESRLLDTENALHMSNSDLEQANETLGFLSDQNVELRVLLKDLYVKKSETEDQWEEQKEVIKSLEGEILNMTSSIERKLSMSIEDIENDLRRVTSERDELREEVCSLNDKLEMVYAIADEKEAIAVEARQESEASKVYAEQKEEEVKILENSVEELESTINVLEKKVYEMNDEVDRHQLIRDSLELELQAFRQRLVTVENLTEVVDSDNPKFEQINSQISRQLHKGLLELQEARKQIQLLEEERAEQNIEMKQCKKYISELILHAEAQASQYQQKYKTLEATVKEVKTDISNSASVAPISDNTEKLPVRTRGSSSPFRCITGLVQHMNLEKDQELSTARRRIEELESLVACRQKEVCMLNARLAATESMTHDVIRDLLGVKLDMTNYANLVNKHQIQKLMVDAQQQTEDFLAKEQEIFSLREKINDLIQDRERCISEIHKKEADILSNQMKVEQLRDRDQLLTAQNEMLKMDKANLKQKIAELDEMVKTLLQTHRIAPPKQHTLKIKENKTKRGDVDLTGRLSYSERLLSRVNDELAQYNIPSTSTSYQPNRTYGHGPEAKFRKKPSLG